MRKIELTRGQFALVDDEDYEYITQWKWHARWNRSTQSFYASRNERKGIGNGLIQMHREIMKTQKGMICDHENHDTLNNQKHNLRNVSYSQNNMNSRLRKDNKLGERCIWYEQNKYKVRINKNKQVAFRGQFDDLEAAKKVRDEMVLKIHGNFAYMGE